MSKEICTTINRSKIVLCIQHAIVISKTVASNLPAQTSIISVREINPPIAVVAMAQRQLIPEWISSSTLRRSWPRGPHPTHEITLVRVHCIVQRTRALPSVRIRESILMRRRLWWIVWCGCVASAAAAAVVAGVDWVETVAHGQVGRLVSFPGEIGGYVVIAVLMRV